MTGDAAGLRAPVEDRLRAAGLPALPRTAWLEIDLGRLAANIAAIRGALPTAALEIVVKADAYGHGAVQVAAAALQAGATGLCVATLDEALELRRPASGRRSSSSSPSRPTEPRRPPGPACRSRPGMRGSRSGRSRRTARPPGAPDVNHRPRDAARDRDGPRTDGLTAREAVAAAAAIAATPGAALGGAWSHLQAPGDQARTDDQVARFSGAVAAVRRAGVDVPHRHVLASGGLLAVERLVAGRRPVFDGLRVGLVAYGIAPDGLAIGGPAAEIHAALRPVLSLRARPIRVADLPAGVGISYGPSFVTTRPSRIATLPVGYADGWSRSLSNRASALVRGARVPLVGSVAMDAVMADVTDLPGAPVTPDDEFVLLGEQEGDAIPATELAQERTTISWEIVATMSRRLPRVYTAGAVAVGNPYAHGGTGVMAQLALWNGDICDLEVDALVSPANVTLWMSTGVAGAIKRRGGDAIEFAAVRQGAGSARRGDRDGRGVARRALGDPRRLPRPPAPDECRDNRRGRRSAVARARELGAETLAIPALGTGVGGFPLEEAAQITVAAVRDAAAGAPRLRTVTFALRGAAAYEAFRAALAAAAPAPAGRTPA